MAESPKAIPMFELNDIFVAALAFPPPLVTPPPPPLESGLPFEDPVEPVEPVPVPVPVLVPGVYVVENVLDDPDPVVPLL